TLGSVLPRETGSAAGLQNFLRTIALAIVTSLVLTIWGNYQRIARTDMAGTINPADTQATLAQSGFSGEQSRQLISNLVEQEAVAMAVDHVFLISAMAMLGAAMLVWLAPRPA